VAGEAARAGARPLTPSRPLPAAGLRWSDGFVFALTIPAALIATLGYSIAALGGWGAVALWGASMLVATAANWIYSELAAMFPATSGGIALYASEGWRSRFPLAGPIGAFGYWFAWTGSLAVYGEIIGDLVRTRWAAGADWALNAGFVEVGFADVVAVGALVAAWVPNVLGVRPTLRVAYVTAAMLVVPLAVLLAAPWISGDWSAGQASPGSSARATGAA
jgi:hypothetical protein